MVSWFKSLYLRFYFVCCVCVLICHFTLKNKKNTTILSIFFVDNNKWLNHTVCMCNNEKRKTKSTKETEKEKKIRFFFWRFVVCLQKKKFLKFLSIKEEWKNTIAQK